MSRFFGFGQWFDLCQSLPAATEKLDGVISATKINRVRMVDPAPLPSRNDRLGPNLQLRIRL